MADRPQLRVKEGREDKWEGLQRNLFIFFEGIKFALTRHTVFMVALTVFATFLCAKGVLDFSFDFSMSIVAVGTVFPLVFSVQASFSRREQALKALAQLKGTTFAVYLMFKTWDQSGDGRFVADADGILQKLLDDIIHYMSCERRTAETGHCVYDGFTALAEKMREFVPKSGYSKPGEGGLSRMQLYLRDMINDFEQMRAVRDSETPIGLRLFCFSLIHISPILLAPYWNHFCDKQWNSEMPTQLYGCESGYFVGIFYVLIVLSLYRVQSELEDPFDGSGADDIQWDLWRPQLAQMSTYGADGPASRARG
eukprot:CAMPEP_0196743022 /NCGR_PEP_ID=MMETSP1091-20130531/50259_1 /TAXON_ID=302021 /ORGANISM="Rhodomonas sp., Strain CCMP768" /LENGTH=309 /DNA_ID=CAMNT_0042089249 /DNA_START=8 /DNA_END=934 /DNA_ORIENTATION=-